MSLAEALESAVAARVLQTHGSVVAEVLRRLEQGTAREPRSCSYRQGLPAYVRAKQRAAYSNSWRDAQVRTHARWAMYQSPCHACEACLRRKKPWPDPGHIPLPDFTIPEQWQRASALALDAMLAAKAKASTPTWDA